MNTIYDLFNELGNMFYEESGVKSFPVDVLETENGYQVIADMPGVSKEDVKLSFEDGTLTIEAKRTPIKDVKYYIHERNNYNLKRSIAFNEIDEDSIKARMENGLLYVDVTVKKPEEKKKKSIIIE